MFSSQGLRLTTTSRRDPRLVSWPLLVAVPVVSGNHWCWSFTCPTLLVLYNSEQPGKLHWFSITGLKLRGENKFKHVCDLGRLNWWSVICQSDFYKSNLCLNWSEWPAWLLKSEGLSVILKCFTKFKLIILTLKKSAHYHPACIPWSNAN